MQKISECEKKYYINELRAGKSVRVIEGIQKSFLAGVSALGIVACYSMITKSPEPAVQVGCGAALLFCSYMTFYHLKHLPNLLKKRNLK